MTSLIWAIVVVLFALWLLGFSMNIGGSFRFITQAEILLRGPERDDHTLYSSHTTWRSRAAFETWTRSEAFRLAHRDAGANRPLLSRPSRIRGVRGDPDHRDGAGSAGRQIRALGDADGRRA